MTPAFQSFVLQTDHLSRFVSATNSFRLLLAGSRESSEPTLLERELHDMRYRSPNSVNWRVLEHTLTVTHLYALFENFCEETVAEWTDFMVSKYQYHDLPAKTRDAYKAGFARILDMLPTPRFPTLTVPELVANFDAAIQGESDYRLEPACLTLHRNNLRWPDICEIFGRCDVSNLGDWINANNRIAAYFDGDTKRLVDQVEARLSNFIQYRNDCSHGVVATDEILGHDDLLDLIEFVTAVADALSQLVTWKRIDTLQQIGGALCLGDVREVYQKAGALVAQVSGTSIHVGQDLYWKKAGSFGVERVISLQVNGEDHESIDAEEPVELGIRLATLPKKGAKLFTALNAD